MPNISTFLGKNVHTLGQLPNSAEKGGGSSPKSAAAQEVTLPSEGVTLHLKNLTKRARSKWYTKAISGRLMYQYPELERSPNDSMFFYYRRAFFCNEQLTQEGKKIKSKFCDTRVCHICNRIRTAKMMSGYISQFRKFDYLEFVTLSIRCVNRKALRAAFRHMRKSVTKIIRSIREWYKIDISGLIKVECTYNFIMDWYHPHIHIIVAEDSGFPIGAVIVEKWMELYPDDKSLTYSSSFEGQDCKEADIDCLNELFKYQTKIITGSKNNLLVHIPALDTIMSALKGMRTFQPFGKIRKIAEDIEGIQSQVYEDIPDYPMMVWLWDETDWHSTSSGEPLTGYVPPDLEINFVE
jgi:hypothetical protein